MLFVLSAMPVHAQNGINSPYSRYGMGILSDGGVGINKAMGGLGIGLRSRNTLNTLNPAAYSTVDTLTFLMDFGFSMQNVNFKENNVRLNARNAYVDYFSIQFRLVPRLGFTMGLQPFSNVGYNFSETAVVRNDEDGSVVSTNSYAGTGGLRTVYAGLGWAAFKWLSVGANVKWVFGDLKHEIANSYSETSIYSRTKAYETDLSSVFVDFGAQTSFKMGGGDLALGFTFAPGMDLKGDTYVYDQVLSGTGTSATVETADTARMDNAFRMPTRLGAGFTFTKGKWMAGADVTYGKWSEARFFGNSGADALRVSVGGSFLPDAQNRKFLMHTTYRVGAHFSQPYYKVGGLEGPKEYGVSLGLSMPIVNRYNNSSNVNVSGEFVHVAPSASHMITENYMRLNIGISFNERWFMKWQVE